MAERLDEVCERIGKKTSKQPRPWQAQADFWQDLAEELHAAKTKAEKDAIWERYEAERKAAKPTRRQRRGSTLDAVQFRPLNRDQRARVMFLAERLDANTHQPYQHGGCLKRTGLQVLRILLFHYHNVATGRCDPSIDTIAKAAGMARSTVIAALKRLEDAGIIERIRRARWVRVNGRKRCVQWSNAYRMNVPKMYRQAEGNFANSAKSSKSGSRSETTSADIKNQPPMPENVAAALARLGNTMATRFEMENERRKNTCC